MSKDFVYLQNYLCVILQYLISMGKRIACIDWVKAISIMLMVIGHSSAPYLLTKGLYSFHMALFFIVSGYLMKPHTIRMTLQTLLVPIAFCSIINIIITWISGSEFVLSWYGGSLFAGLWFIYVIASIRILLDIFKDAFYKYYGYLFAVCVLFSILQNNGYINLPDYFKWIFSSFPIVIAGIYIKRNGLNIKPVMLIGLLLLSIIYVTISERFDIRYSAYGQSYLAFLLSSLVISITIIKIFKYFPENKTVVTISSGTILFLGLNKNLIKLFHCTVPGVLWKYEWIIVSLETIVFCYLLAALCLRFCPWALGKFKKN